MSATRVAPSALTARRAAAASWSRRSASATSAAATSATVSGIATATAPSRSRPCTACRWFGGERERDDRPAEHAGFEQRHAARGHHEPGPGELGREPVGRVHGDDTVGDVGRAPRPDDEPELDAGKRGDASAAASCAPIPAASAAPVVTRIRATGAVDRRLRAAPGSGGDERVGRAGEHPPGAAVGGAERAGRGVHHEVDREIACEVVDRGDHRRDRERAVVGALPVRVDDDRIAPRGPR